jgi:hypothetical protein
VEVFAHESPDWGRVKEKVAKFGTFYDYRGETSYAQAQSDKKLQNEWLAAWLDEAIRYRKAPKPDVSRSCAEGC